ncbi:MAG: ATP-binding protein [Crocinitomicaceae bacterium]|nr:ATP-binding protein [Crocinitomicaceae bacterium]
MKNSALYISRVLSVVLALIINFTLLAGEDDRVDQFNHLRSQVVAYQQVNIDTSDMYVDSCIILAKEMDESYYLGKAYHMNSQIMILQSEDDSALYYMNASNEIMRNYKDSIDYFVMEYNLGNLYLYRGEQISALVQYKKVIHIIDDNFEHYATLDFDRVSLNRAYTYVSIATVFGMLGDQHRKKENLRRALRISRRIKTDESQILKAVVLGNIGLTYYELEDYEIAESYTISGLDLKIELGLKALYGYNYQALAKIALGRGKISAALRYLDLADKSFEEFGVTGELDANQFIYAQAYFEKGDYDKAISYLLSLMNVYEDKYAKTELAEVYMLYGDCLLKQGNAQEAFVQYQIANIVKRDLNREKKATMIAQYLDFFKKEEMQIKRKLQDAINLNQQQKIQLKLDQESNNRRFGYTTFSLIIAAVILVIFILLNANRRKKQMNLELSNSIEDKQLLFKEVHHRVKNNFQVISSLLSLQQGTSGDLDEQKALGDAQARIQSMALVHELLYKRNEIKSLDFKEYLEELVKSLFTSLVDEESNITYAVNCDYARMELDVAIPLGLLVNEAVTNSLKYAFTDLKMGHVSIDLDKLGRGNYQLTVKDNGGGIPEDILSEDRNTLGIELIRILADQLQGEVKFDVTDGTTVTLTFNKNLS